LASPSFRAGFANVLTVRSKLYHRTRQRLTFHNSTVPAGNDALRAGAQYKTPVSNILRSRHPSINFPILPLLPFFRETSKSDSRQAHNSNLNNSNTFQEARQRSRDVLDGKQNSAQRTSQGNWSKQGNQGNQDNENPGNGSLNSVTL
jgi:hypothetical protein